MKPLLSFFNIAIFTPTSKVHVQRDVMREVDERLVKYSQRGIFLTLLVFSLAMLMGEYYINNPKMAIALGGGLVCITFIRIFFLLKFDQLYAKGPGRWRNLFFYSSLAGSAWWGFVIANITLANGLQYETPILWLYTVAFFTGSIYIFAPFQRFLKLYMFASFIPCAVIAILMLEAISVLYGVIMIVLYILLCRQGKIIGQNYWDKLQATYELLQKANALQAEKLTTESSLNNQDVLFNNLTRELKSSMQEILGSLKLIKNSSLPKEEEQVLFLAEQKAQQQLSLLRNVAELANISTKKLLLDQHVIDPRYHIEEALNNISIIAHKKHIELFSSFASDFPLRIRGDAERFEQLLGNLISSACQFAVSGELLLSSSYRLNEDPGTLKITLINATPIRTPETEEQIHTAFSPYYASDIKLGLSLAIVKGLAQCMDGNAGAYYRDDGALLFWVSIKLSAVSTGVMKTSSQLKLSGKKTLLYQAPKTIADVFSHTLTAWGLDVDIVNDEQAALALLEDNIKDSPYQLVIIYTQLDDVSGLQLSKKIADHAKLWATPQIVTLSKLQTKQKEVEEHFLKYVSVGVIYKPIQHRPLQKMIKSFLLSDHTESTNDADKDNFLEGKHILLFQQEDIDLVIVKAMLKSMGCVVESASTMSECEGLLETISFDAFICESHLENENLPLFVENARKVNDVLRDNHYKLPVLGLTSHELAGEETHCLASGMEYYIDSPTNIDDLRAILRRFIGRAAHMAENQ
jgi:signal transduction histidine kinase/DNA-binding response OmpR family regulator